MRSSGFSVKMLSIVPICTLVKSYSSIIGTGTELSIKTLGLMVILSGSDRLLLQLEEKSNMNKSKILPIKLKFFVVDFKGISLNEYSLLNLSIND